MPASSDATSRGEADHLGLGRSGWIDGRSKEELLVALPDRHIEMEHQIGTSPPESKLAVGDEQRVRHLLAFSEREDGFYRM
jgi:hypothetical protein